MSRRVIALAGAILLAATTARADDPPADAGAPAPSAPAPVEAMPGEGASGEAMPGEPVPGDAMPSEAAPSELSSAPAPAITAPGLAATTSVASVDETAARSAADEIGDQGVGVAIGIAAGGGVTPGGLRVTGHYLYQLSSQDWFDGIASFTLGGGDAVCFRDREDELICDHGFLEGGAVEIAAGVRRMFAAEGAFRPFARVAIGLAWVRYSDDEISGLAVPVHVGGGVRTRVANGVAVVAHADLAVGFSRFTDGLGLEPHLGLAVTAGAEFRLP